MAAVLQFAIGFSDPITCCSCGIAFSLPASFERKLRESHKGFYCPNGHSLTFKGETEAERLRRQIDQEKKANERLRSWNDSLTEQRDRKERQLRAAKGVLTKTKKRIAHGVCPSCNRTFVGLQKHMETKHPDYVAQSKSEEKEES